MLVEHRNVARLFAATDAWFGFGPDDVWTLFHSYAFDFSVWELWGALLYGGRVVVVPFDVSRDPEAFHALVQREGVTVLSQTPSAFRQFMPRWTASGAATWRCATVVFGGEALEPATLREWVERHGAETPRLVNMYGITETTVHVTWRPLGREDVSADRGAPSGGRSPTCGCTCWTGAAAGAGRGAGRAVRGRRGRGARLPEPPGADGGALRRRPVRAEPARGCTGRATWRGGWRTGRWSTWAGWTSR